MDKKTLLTIKQFAKLTNIHPKSLRYYDSIGVLNPAWVDPESGYRYYSFFQKEEVFMIKMAVDMGLPLKALTNYHDPVNNIVYYKTYTSDLIYLLEERIQEMQRHVQSLKWPQFDHAQKLLSAGGPIRERMPELIGFHAPFSGVQFTDDWHIHVLALSKTIVQHHCTIGYTGLMSVKEQDTWRQYLYITVWEPVENMESHPAYFRISEGEYLCSVVPESGLDQAIQWAGDLMPVQPELMLEIELTTEDYHYFPPHLEQRILLNPQ